MLPSRECRVQLPDEIIRYFRVNRRDLVYLKFILEAYEGMSTMTSVNPAGIIVRISTPAGFQQDIAALLTTITNQIPLVEVINENGDPLDA